MKTCKDCNRALPIDKFAINRTQPDGRHSQCKECKKVYNRAYYERTKQIHNPGRAKRRSEARKYTQSFVRAYLKKHSCVDCGISDIRVLEFDHVRGEKAFNISTAIMRNRSIKVIIDEISKCEVVCANCHRIRTCTRQPTYRTKGV